MKSTQQKLLDAKDWFKHGHIGEARELIVKARKTTDRYTLDETIPTDVRYLWDLASNLISISERELDEFFNGPAQ